MRTTTAIVIHVLGCLALATTTTACGSSGGENKETVSSQTGQAISGAVATHYSCFWNAPGTYYNGGPGPNLQTTSDGESIVVYDYPPAIPRTGASDGTMSYHSDNLFGEFGESTFVVDIGLLTGAESGNMGWILPSSGSNDAVNFTCRR